MERATRLESKRVRIRPAAGGSLGRRRVGVRYLDAGDGRPVVLLHGVGLDAATVSWRFLLPELAATRRVVALDFPGHGESDKPRRRYTTDYYRQVLEAFLEAVDIEEASLVGVSMGGAVALGRALEAPDRVDRLVLVGSYGLGGDAPWRPAASVALRTPLFGRAWWASLRRSREAVREHLRAIVGPEPSEEFVDDVYAAVQDPGVARAGTSWQRSEFRSYGFRTDYRGQLPGCEIPTLLVHGSRDPLVPTAWSKRAAELLPRGELRVFEGYGHWPTRERPGRFNRVVRDFLA